MTVRKIGAAVTVSMTTEQVADICGVPVEDVRGYGNGYASVYEDVKSGTPAAIASPREGVEPQEGETVKPKRKPRAKRKKVSDA